MPTTKAALDFTTSQNGIDTLRQLEAMASDDGYNTPASYSANTALYPDNLISFVDKHMLYLKTHTTVNTQHYISNLKLMTRLK